MLEARYAHLDRDPAVAADEMEDLYYRKSRYDPYRWYRLPANYRGKQVVLDRFGFRNDPEILDAPGQARVGLYGGSTMFSTTTNQAGSIPSLLGSADQDRYVRFLNFGIGGYASSAEFSAFIETSRLIPDIRYAVFYDGVNEVGRFIERLQDRAQEPHWNAVSYPFRTALDAALFGRRADDKPYAFPYSLYIATRAWARLRGTEVGPVTIDYEAAADAIARIYVENARDINAVAAARGIAVLFVLQPVIYTTANLSPSELRIAERRSDVDLARIHRLAYDRIRQSFADLPVRFADLSDALSDKSASSTYFVDYCHLTAEGNARVANKLADRLRSHFPDLRM